MCEGRSSRNEELHMRITYDMLIDSGACEEQCEVFQECFSDFSYPDGVEVTRERCIQYAACFDWAAGSDLFFGRQARDTFDRLTNRERRIYISSHFCDMKSQDDFTMATAIAFAEVAEFFYKTA